MPNMTALQFGPRPTSVTFSLADWLVIESLAPETREVVERYIAIGGRAAIDPDPDENYKRGWRDAMEHARDEVGGVSLPYTPPSKRR